MRVGGYHGRTCQHWTRHQTPNNPCQAHVCKEICKEGQQAVLDFFGNKAIVGTKGATAYSFKEPTMPQKSLEVVVIEFIPFFNVVVVRRIWHLLWVGNIISCESSKCREESLEFWILVKLVSTFLLVESRFAINSRFSKSLRAWWGKSSICLFS